jgi:cytochrome oxidase assembly protein ShyY1
MNVRNFISQENEQTTKRNINTDEIHVKVTFKVKYKSKDSSLQTKKKKSQNKILEGYITEDNVALKRSDNIDKNLSDFMRNQPTYLKKIFLLSTKKWKSH